MKYLLIALILVSCGKKDNLDFYEVEKKDFDHLINDSKKRTTSKPHDLDFAKTKTILNRDYPIEIALYDDGKWFYDLPNLDKGSGTWKYTEGRLELFAERDLFDMHIDVVVLEEDGKIIGIDFVDRHGRQVLPVEKINATK